MARAYSLDDMFRNMGLTLGLPEPEAQSSREEEDPYRHDDNGGDPRWLLSVKYDIAKISQWGIGDFGAIAQAVEKMLPDEVNNPNRFAKTCCTVPDGCGVNWPPDYNRGRNAERYQQCWRPNAPAHLKCTKCVERGCMPSTNTCWKSSYFWRLSKSMKMLQIIENGQLGDGQQIEQEMAKFLGAEIRTIHINWDPGWQSAISFGTGHCMSAESKIGGKDNEIRNKLRAAGFGV